MVKEFNAYYQNTPILNAPSDELINFRLGLSDKVGDVIKRDYVNELRPCPKEGLPPYKINTILGKTLRNDINKGACITEDDIKK